MYIHVVLAFYTGKLHTAIRLSWTPVHSLLSWGRFDWGGFDWVEFDWVEFEMIIYCKLQKKWNIHNITVIHCI